MRLTTLSDPVLILEQHMNSSRRILRESCQDLTSEQKKIVEGIYNELIPLIEASLTADQIKQIFGSIEQQSIAGGQDRTLLGKGVDTAKKANDIINNVGKWLQDTAPVKMADQKFEQLKAKVAEKFPDLDKQLTDFGTWMKENPGKSAAVIGVLTALASLAGGPVGGAIAGQVLRGAAELIKGEKLSTAVGKGIKTAAVGWLAGFAMDKIGDMISDVYKNLNPVPISGFNQYYQVNVGNGLPNVFRDASIYGSKDQLDQFNGLWGQAVKSWRAGDFEQARDIFSQAQTFAAKVTQETMTKIAIEGDPAEKIKLVNQALGGLTAAAQGAAAGATAYDKSGKPVAQPQANKESYYTQQRPLSEGQVYLVFDRVLTEAGFLDKLKTGAGKVAGAVGQSASWLGKQATEKNTSAKLTAAWKMAGSPTDSEQLKAFLKDQGISDEIVTKVYTDMKIPTAASATEPEAVGTMYTQVKTQLNQLNKKDRQRLMAYLQKSLGTV